MRFAKAATLWVPESFQKSLPNAAIYPLRFASGGFFLVESRVSIVRVKTRLTGRESRTIKHDYNKFILQA